MGKTKKTETDEIAKLERLTTRQLQFKVKRLTGKATRSTDRAALIKRCREAIEAGGPAPRKKRKRGPTVQLDPGTVITRKHKGSDITVTATETGFEWDGTAYPSLSAVAQAITGYGVSGPHFFKLTER